jgi:hypothetical protein
MAILFANNANSTVAGPITSTVTTVNLSAGTGAAFPNPVNPGDYFCGTFYDQLTKTRTEIVHCTARAGDTLTIQRAQEGTLGQAWSAGDLFGNLVTAGSLNNFVQAGTGPSPTSLIYTGADTSATANAVVAATTPIPAALATGMQFNIKIKNTNTGPSTLQLNGGSAVPTVRSDGSAMLGKELTINEEMIFVYNGTQFNALSPANLGQSQVAPGNAAGGGTKNQFYCRPDGNDNNDGLQNSPQHACLTIQGIIQKFRSGVYLACSDVWINCLDGTYFGGFSDRGGIVGTWHIIGNLTTPDNCIVDCSANIQSPNYPAYCEPGRCCVAYGNSIFDVQGFRFKSWNECVLARGGQLTLTTCHYESPFSGPLWACYADQHGILTYIGNHQFVVTGRPCLGWHYAAGGQLVFGLPVLPFGLTGPGPCILTLSSAIAFQTSYLGCWNNATVLCNSGLLTFVGPIPPCVPYYVQTGGGLTLNGCVWPGSLAVVLNDPGWVTL